MGPSESPCGVDLEMPCRCEGKKPQLIVMTSRRLNNGYEDNAARYAHSLAKWHILPVGQHVLAGGKPASLFFRVTVIADLK